LNILEEKLAKYNLYVVGIRKDNHNMGKVYIGGFLNSLPIHGFWRRYHDFVSAFRTNIGFAAGTGKTVATGAIQLFFVPKIITVFTPYFIIFRLHLSIISVV